MGLVPSGEGLWCVLAVGHPLVVLCPEKQDLRLTGSDAISIVASRWIGRSLLFQGGLLKLIPKLPWKDLYTVSAVLVFASVMLSIWYGIVRLVLLLFSWVSTL